MQCYLVVEQAEYATDVLLANPSALKAVYQERHYSLVANPAKVASPKQGGAKCWCRALKHILERGLN
jgi:hypothetical protein